MFQNCIIFFRCPTVSIIYRTFPIITPLLTITCISILLEIAVVFLIVHNLFPFFAFTIYPRILFLSWANIRLAGIFLELRIKTALIFVDSLRHSPTPMRCSSSYRHGTLPVLIEKDLQNADLLQNQSKNFSSSFRNAL